MSGVTSSAKPPPASWSHSERSEESVWVGGTMKQFRTTRPHRSLATLGMTSMILLFLFALLPRIEIVSANDASVTYRELVPLRVALDPETHLFHYAGCPAIRPGMERVSPAAATLRQYKEHTCVALRKDEYASHTEERAPHDPKPISVLFLGN